MSREINNVSLREIKKISIKEKDFPKCLKEIKDPPEIIYWRGELPKDNSECFAIVGTRLCSEYGKRIALEFAANLSDAGFIIVSGLAPGIDTYSHTAVVEKKRKTIAVLGTGIDEKSIYPKENIPLSRKILETGGCLISEYPPGTNGSKITFPARNRIISALSVGVLIVEAKEKSGALITADYAKRQNRKLFAAPGSIYSLNSKGPNMLIKKGAQLVENSNDILKELKMLARKKSAGSAVTGENEEENLILQAIKEEALYIEKIIEKTNLPASAALGTLAILEIQGKVRNLGNNIYAPQYNFQKTRFVGNAGADNNSNIKKK